LIGFTQARTVPLALLFIGLCGWAGVTTMALTNTLIQLIVPDDLRGRVMSVFTLSLMGLSPLGGMLAGSIAELVGSVPLVVAGSALIGCAVLTPDVAPARSGLSLDQAGKSFECLQAYQANISDLENRLHANPTLTLFGIKRLSQSLRCTVIHTGIKWLNSKP